MESSEIQIRALGDGGGNPAFPLGQCGGVDLGVSESNVEFGDQDFTDEEAGLKEGDGFGVEVGDDVHNLAVHFANLVCPCAFHVEVGSEVSDRLVGWYGGDFVISYREWPGESVRGRGAILVAAGEESFGFTEV